jgi:hypothetical protein
VEAGKLVPGEIVDQLDGAGDRVVSVEPEKSLQDTYNFEVADAHSYFVGNSHAWVHNTCGPDEIPTTEPLPKPGDEGFVGPVNRGGWRLVERGDGAHLVERSNAAGRTALSQFDQANTPRYYPNTTPEAAGAAHVRLHQATAAEGIQLKGGNPNLNDQQLLDAYVRAYSRPEIQGIRGDVRTPTGAPIPGGTNVGPADAIDALLKYYGLK